MKYLYSKQLKQTFSVATLYLYLCMLNRLYPCQCFQPIINYSPTSRFRVYEFMSSQTSTDYTTDQKLSVDPLLVNILSGTSISSVIDIGGILLVSNGIKVWRRSLSKGRLPTNFDFDLEAKETGELCSLWPIEPLFSKLSEEMVSMQLPLFTLRHPESITAVLISLLRLTIKFSERLGLLQRYNEEGERVESHNESDDFSPSQDQEESLPSSREEEINEILEEISSGLTKEWSGVVNGCGLLGELFGHDLISLNNENGNNIADSKGFGLHDGVWQHTGWRGIPQLQRKISSMPELRELLHELGRRPSAENNNDKLHKFAPRKLNQNGGMGAQFDPQKRELVSGVTFSGNLFEMLPSEAVLLRGSSPTLRRLFLAKKAESKLLSYQMLGWTDVPSIPKTQSTSFHRLPSSPGGPIIVCLDTSWSMMSGTREQISKAVVLACVSTAHRQGRECQVVAFSTERGVMEAGLITADSFGIPRLLDFLSHSFGGGTDVTGALKFALKTLNLNLMSDGADILMISDGEIPDPPISEDLMKELDRLKLQKGVKVHGLLVGQSESKPLTRICTETHDFLMKYDTQASIMTSYHISSSTELNYSSFSSSRTRKALLHKRKSCIPRMRTLLHAKASRYQDDGRTDRQERKKKQKRGKWDDDDYYYSFEDNAKNQHESKDIVTNNDSYSDEVSKAIEVLMVAVAETDESQVCIAEAIEKEKYDEGSCWQYQSELKAAVQRVKDGLVEREQEARLVVLAMMATEHIILLGVPGTGKSILGRRLSKLCDGEFFQRLLTKFTTPEELFGPLSLKSLENDEYRRCTTGFLPTASVAFLDEIFKANSAILNTLLTILNERKFDNAGGQEFVPIRCVVGASNELPDNEEIMALFDRFLIRKEVSPVSDEGLLKMLSMSNPGFSSCDNDEVEESTCDIISINDFDEVVNALSKATDSVKMGRDACELMRDLRTFMREEQNSFISDRRLVKVARLLKISAASHGRTKVDPIDCILLQHCMWQLPEQREAIKNWLWQRITPVTISGPGDSVDQFQLLLDSLRQEFLTVIRRTSGDVTGRNGAREADVILIQSLLLETSRITDILCQRQADLFRHMELLRKSEEFLWLDPDEAKAMKQSLLPPVQAITVELNITLTNARALEISLSELPAAPSNDLRLSVIEQLWEERSMLSFTDDELNMGMKEAKSRFDIEIFRKWKRAKKNAQKKSR